jgi:hypothetical protein
VLAHNLESDDLSDIEEFDHTNACQFWVAVFFMYIVTRLGETHSGLVVWTAGPVFVRECTSI